MRPLRASKLGELMGEAKRRKQLGLMPTVHPFDATMDADGTLTFTRAPEDAAHRELIAGALRFSQPYGAAWESQYRTLHVMHGRVDRFLETAEDVQSIPVPALRRLSGELALGRVGEGSETTGRFLPVEGGAVRLREVQHSFDGVKWDAFPVNMDPRRAMEFLLQHPAATLGGEVVATYVAEQWREGRLDIDPEPPAELLDMLESLAREWHGDTEEGWQDTHLDATDGDDTDPVPVARRVAFELRQPAPLQSPLNMAFATLGNVEVTVNREASSYSLDGEAWISYADPDGEAREDALDLPDFLDVETVPVQVFADGRVEWVDEDVPAEHGERLRADLLLETGAGNPTEWAQWTRELITQTFEHELVVPEDAELPVPVAVLLDIPLDALDDPDPLAQSFIESAITFDGTNWRDLYDEVLPEELRPFLDDN